MPIACVEDVDEEVPEVPKDGVGTDAFAGIKSIFNSDDVSTGVSLILSASSLVNMASIYWIFVEELRVTSKSVAASQVTPTGKEVWIYLDLISYCMISPISILFLDMFIPRQATL